MKQASVTGFDKLSRDQILPCIHVMIRLHHCLRGRALVLKDSYLSNISSSRRIYVVVNAREFQPSYDWNWHRWNILSRPRETICILKFELELDVSHVWFTPSS